MTELSLYCRLFMFARICLVGKLYFKILALHTHVHEAAYAHMRGNVRTCILVCVLINIQTNLVLTFALYHAGS